MDFREYVKRKILKKNDRILEFGPLTRPTVTKETHPGVHFADVRSTADIRKLYTSNAYLQSTGLSVDLESIVDIDFVVNGTYEESFRNIEKFDKIILSHVIEHMPDILYFFKDIINILKPSGQLILIYPDARYCFDHFRNGSSFVDAYDVYQNKTSSSKRVLDFVYNVVSENNPQFYWGNAKQNKLLPNNSFNDAIDAYNKASRNELPDDTHFWPFADYQFIKFLYDMDRAGMLEFDIAEFKPTQKNTQEFMIILTPKSKETIDSSKYIKILNKISPQSKEINAEARIEHMRKLISNLESEKMKLNNELRGMQNSRSWKFVTRLVKLKNKLKVKNGKSKI